VLSSVHQMLYVLKLRIVFWICPESHLQILLNLEEKKISYADSMTERMAQYLFLQFEIN